jgi:nitrate/TMAO reductase-like tetraheme cytochrome c subunit
VLFYLIIGAGVVGVFFSLPHLKKLLTRSASLPMISVFSWRGKLLMAIPVAGLALLVVTAYSLKLTGHPKFCTSCHNMDEYYGSWQHSAHKNVACIDCHYEPGPTAMVEGKLAGLVQVVKYVSHSYSTKPHALISNSSCMRGGCHAEMDVKKDTLLFREQINFRHDVHLTKRPRGKVLNCVSCHGQTTQGEHIGVTRTTCITCHFHGRDVKSLAAGRCDTCHRLPSTAVTFMGQSFDHKKFLEGKTAVRCEHCHSRVTQGEGAVSATRCRSCHLDKELKVTDQEQFHLVHVSKGHFDCLQCHDEIKHGARPPDEQLAFGNCNGCHAGERHSVQERMYAGTAIPGLKAMPDPMFKARVACDGCHMDVRSAELGEKPFTRKVAGAKQCADCHGREKYGEMLADWQEDTKDRLEELQAELAKLAKACQSADADVAGAELTKAKALLSSARTRLSYIVSDGSFGAHNYPYVSEALDSVETDIETGRSLAAGWKKVASRSP